MRRCGGQEKKKMFYDFFPKSAWFENFETLAKIDLFNLHRKLY